MAELTEPQKIAREVLTAFPGGFPPHAPNGVQVFRESLVRAVEDLDTAVAVVYEVTRLAYLAASGLAIREGASPNEPWTKLFELVDQFDERRKGGDA